MRTPESSPSVSVVERDPITMFDSERSAAPVQAVRGWSGLAIRKVVWGIALAASGLAAVNGFATIALQTSAPQQAAAGAIACFHLITPYVLARAIDELTRRPGN